ncbi:carboxypeptidase S [Dentipellis sp. KUC8613]|nr:carboxypeptidase S [Dentipellis sp. KUC8613]
MAEDKHSSTDLPYVVTQNAEGQRKQPKRVRLDIPFVLLMFMVGIACAKQLHKFVLRRSNCHAEKPVHLEDYPLPPHVNSSYCPQSEAIFPIVHGELNAKLEKLYLEESFQLKAFEQLGRVIRVPSESHDDLRPVGEDDRWNVFGDLHSVLESTFPLVFDKLKATKVNTYNIVLHWQGSDTTLKPILLTAHQDVVPVEPTTVEQWEQPPYSGFYDGAWIWGRGTADDKGSLVAQLITVDALLRNGFVPKRTIVFAYGIDEESSGLQGAGKIATYLEETYGKDGFAILVDEGGGYLSQDGGKRILAVPAVSEKGYLDVRVEVNTPGGHSSVPPRHTSIGILSSLLTHIEAHPHVPALPRNSTPFHTTLCLASYSTQLPSELRRVAFDAVESDEALERLRDGLLARDPIAAAMLGTTQAVDLVWGGVKVNALPETASGVINHRIAEHSSVAELQKDITELLSPVASLFNLSVNAFGKNVGEGGAGDLVLSDAWGTALEPSPVSPTLGSGPWKLLSGTIKATVQGGEEGADAVVIPSLGIGNTDTKSYWSLTRHIFRYTHIGPEDMRNGAHTVNEAIRATSVITELRFFTKLILNADESLLL